MCVGVNEHILNQVNVREILNITCTCTCVQKVTSVENVNCDNLQMHVESTCMCMQ